MPLNRDGASLAADFVLTATYADVLTVRLTPSTTSKKIRIRIGASSSNGNLYSLRLRRGNEDVFEILSIASDETPAAASEQPEPLSFFTVDAPGSAAEQTYVLQGKRDASAVSISAGTAMIVEEI